MTQVHPRPPASRSARPVPFSRRRRRRRPLELLLLPKLLAAVGGVAVGRVSWRRRLRFCWHCDSGCGGPEDQAEGLRAQGRDGTLQMVGRFVLQHV